MSCKVLIMIFNHQVTNGLYTFCPRTVTYRVILQATKKALEATVSRMFFVFHFLTIYYYFLHFNNTWSIFIAPNEHNYGERIIRCCLFCIQFECLWQKDSVLSTWTCSSVRRLA